ncbi:MAG TPA: hypothetical protein VFA11_07290 [Acidimicrobiales bacterium]|nr:hypothetical protein [Acidimicrobiales bacterium]
MRRLRGINGSALTTVLVVGGMVVFVLWQFHPSLLFLNTTTSGGDTGAHVALPAYMRDHLLPHGRLTGWDPGWYDGFPAFTFYFPLPSLLIVLLNVVMPYNIAFKLVTALGSLALPVAAWAFGRLWGAREPVPACLAVATLPYLFDRSYTIYGGNIASTLAGEYAFSLSLAVGLVCLGVVARGIRTGRHAGLAAFLLAVTGLCHMLPAVFVIAGCVVIALMNPGVRRWAWMAKVAVVSGLLVGFWAIPFLLRLPYTTDMGWVKVHSYLSTLFPSALIWVAALAGVGAVVSLALRRRAGTFLTAMAVLSAVAFVAAPQGKIWNARMLPFWVLCLYLLAGVAVAEVGAAVAAFLRRAWASLDAPPAEGPGRVAVPLLAAAAAAVFVALPLKALPSWVPFHVSNTSFIPDWVRWNYTGYERKDSYAEYRSVIQTMQSVGRRYGCGRAMWEYEPELNRFGTPMALMLLPYWSNGCVDSMEGLLFESAASTPYHFLNQSELSAHPSDAMMGLPYEGLDLQKGIAHLQLLGVRYYMATSPEVQSEAAADPDLKLVATSGPWPVSYSSGTQERTWDIYQVRDSAQVAPLAFEPAVLKGVAKGGKPWLDAAVAWYQDPTRWLVPLAASGPPEWPAAQGPNPKPPEIPVPVARVSNIHTSDDRISFDVDRVGSPVLVKASYFPNWQATGARGPWRVTPNLMVVIPTARHVSLHYGWTPVDGIGWLATFLGVAGLVWLAWPRAEAPADEVAGEPERLDELEPMPEAAAEPVPTGAGVESAP